MEWGELSQAFRDRVGPFLFFEIADKPEEDITAMSGVLLHPGGWAALAGNAMQELGRAVKVVHPEGLQQHSLCRVLFGGPLKHSSGAQCS